MKKLIFVIALISVIFTSHKSFAYNFDFRLTTDNVWWANQQNIFTTYELFQLPIQKINNRFAKVGLDLALAIPLSTIGHEFGGHANACPVPANVRLDFLGFSRGKTECDFNYASATYQNGETVIFYPSSEVEKWYKEGNIPTLVYEAGINFQTGLAELVTEKSIGKEKIPVDMSILRFMNGFELFKYTFITGNPQSSKFAEKANEGYDPADYVLSITQDPNKENSLYSNVMAAGIWQTIGLLPDIANFFYYLSSGEEIEMPDYWLEPLGLLTPYGVEYQLAFFSKDMEIKGGIGKGFNGVDSLARLSARIDNIKIANRVSVSPYIEIYKNLDYGFVSGLEFSIKISREIGFGIGAEAKPTKGFSPEFQFINPCFRGYIDLFLDF